jgi:hypothetical protein
MNEHDCFWGRGRKETANLVEKPYDVSVLPLSLLTPHAVLPLIDKFLGDLLRTQEPCEARGGSEGLKGINILIVTHHGIMQPLIVLEGLLCASKSIEHACSVSACLCPTFQIIQKISLPYY